jgi:hypothetical protein
MAGGPRRQLLAGRVVEPDPFHVAGMRGRSEKVAWTPLSALLIFALRHAAARGRTGVRKKLFRRDHVPFVPVFPSMRNSPNKGAA